MPDGLVDVDGLDVLTGRSLYFYPLCMDNSCRGLPTAAGTGFKAGLAVYLAKLVLQNLLHTFGQFLGPVTKW